MKRKWILPALLVFMMALGLAACHAPLSLKDVEKQNRNKWHVTYDLQGGMFSSQENVDISHYYAKKDGGTYIVEPGAADGALEGVVISRSGYFLEGWYTTKDCDYANRWDFKNDKISGDTVLYAKWLKNFEFRFLYQDDGEWKEIPDTKIIVDGDLLRDETVGFLGTTNRPKRDGYTLIEWYQDEACEEVWDTRTTRHGGKVVGGDNEDTRIQDVYTTWLEGEWEVVKTSREFASAVKSNKNIYLFNDIEFGAVNTITGTNWTSSAAEYDKVIDGNHKSVKNIVMSFPTSAVKVGVRPTYCAIFKKLLGGAVLKNITFENVSLSIAPDDMNWDKYCALLAAEVEENVTFENVTITGTITVKHTKAINNYYFGVVGGSFPAGATLTGIDYTGVTVVTVEDVSYEVDALGLITFL